MRLLVPRAARSPGPRDARLQPLVVEGESPSSQLSIVEFPSIEQDGRAQTSLTAITACHSFTVSIRTARSRSSSRNETSADPSSHLLIWRDARLRGNAIPRRTRSPPHACPKAAAKRTSDPNLTQETSRRPSAGCGSDTPHVVARTHRRRKPGVFGPTVVRAGGDAHGVNTVGPASLAACAAEDVRVW
jgi:hypothetical protein